MALNKFSPMKNKKAAIELSIGTVVIIVLAMTMLIMGVVLVRNIFSGATSSVDTLNDKVKGEITSLFSEETRRQGRHRNWWKDRTGPGSSNSKCFNKKIDIRFRENEFGRVHRPIY